MGEEIANVRGYRLEIREDHLEDPDTILSMSVTLPNGLSAKFGRCTPWHQSQKGLSGTNCPSPESISLTC
jgi:hypothetical protein